MQPPLLLSPARRAIGRAVALRSKGPAVPLLTGFQTIRIAVVAGSSTAQMKPQRGICHHEVSRSSEQ
jgi:hypothetical protein